MDSQKPSGFADPVLAPTGPGRSNTGLHQAFYVAHSRLSSIWWIDTLVLWNSRFGMLKPLKPYKGLLERSGTCLWDEQRQQSCWSLRIWTALTSVFPLSQTFTDLQWFLMSLPTSSLSSQILVELCWLGFGAQTFPPAYIQKNSSAQHVFSTCVTLFGMAGGHGGSVWLQPEAFSAEGHGLLSKVDYCFYAVYLTELVLRFAVYGVLVLKSHWKLGHWTHSYTFVQLLILQQEGLTVSRPLREANWGWSLTHSWWQSDAQFGILVKEVWRITCFKRMRLQILQWIAMNVAAPLAARRCGLAWRDLRPQPWTSSWIWCRLLKSWTRWCSCLGSGIPWDSMGFQRFKAISHYEHLWTINIHKPW